MVPPFNPKTIQFIILLDQEKLWSLTFDNLEP